VSMLQQSFLNHWLEIAVKIQREAHAESARTRIASSYQELASSVEG